MAFTDVSERALHAWEQGFGKSVAERISIVLDIFVKLDDSGLSIALFERDLALIDLFISLRGRRLDTVVQCPGCAADFDLPLDLTEMARQAPEPAAVRVAEAGFSARVRPPAARDLMALPETLSPQDFAAELFLRCVEEATLHGQPVAPAALPPAIRQAAAALLSAQGMASPAARIECALCGHGWEAPLNIARAVLREVEGWAMRLLDDVHRIASAYHWSERDILALPAPRRRYYLEAIG